MCWTCIHNSLGRYVAHGLQVHQVYLELHVHVCVCMRNSLCVVQESELHEAIHCLSSLDYVKTIGAQ